jgi:hypothetical protein
VNKVNKSAGGIPGLRNPIVAREIDKLEPGVDESINLVRLRDKLDETQAEIIVNSEKLQHLLRKIEKKYGKELSPFLHDRIARRADAIWILSKWLDGELPHGVKIVISKEDGELRTEYVYSKWNITSNVFSPDTTIQEVIDWFIHNHDIFEYMVDDVGTATGVYVDKFDFINWLKENNIPSDDPDVKEALELFYKLYNYVDRFNSLIDELRAIVGWKKEEK